MREPEGLFEPKKRTWRPTAFASWAMVFFSVFASNFCTLIMADGQEHPKAGSFLPVFAILAAQSWRPAVFRCRIHDASKTRLVVLAAYLSSIAVALLTLSPEPVLALSLFLGPLYMPLGVYYSGITARYPYSTKTGERFRFFAWRKQLIPDPEKRKPETIDEVLALETADIRGKQPPALCLVLDSEPEGEHYLWFSLPSEQRASSIFSLGRPVLESVFLPLDLRRIEHLRARFGDCKKASIPPAILYARIGDGIRGRAVHAQE